MFGAEFWEVCKQAPGLALLVLVVRMFVGYLKARDTSYIGTLREIHLSTASTQERTVKALDRNTEMYGRVLNVVERHEDKLQIPKETTDGP